MDSDQPPGSRTAAHVTGAPIRVFVHNLGDSALDQMSLSRSRRNAEFLMWHLKALSGRLAIRLTGDKAPTSELIALALCHANSQRAPGTDECWVSLDSGVLIPADDVRDLLPPLAPPGDGGDAVESRPDLIYVTVAGRKGLSFQFVDVKYRRHLRTARSPETLNNIRAQVESLRKRWYGWYCGEDVCAPFRAVRRAKLARVLRFYADKAHRHCLPLEQYETIISEIDRMIEKGGDYSFDPLDRADRGWVFCPDYGGERPLEIAPSDWDTRIFLFGPDLLPDSDFRREQIGPPPVVPQESPETTPIETPVGQTGSDSSLEAGHHGDGPATLDLQTPTGSRAGDAPSIVLGVDVLTGSEVQWLLTIKGNPHLLIAGLPGMGKTTCLLSLCRQMMLAGVRPIIFSYHQDIDEKLQHMVKSVRFIDFDGLGFNPLRVIERGKLAHLDVAGALRDIFTAIFPELGDIQGERIRRAIKESFAEKGWEEPDAVAANLADPPFERFVEILRNDPKPDRGLRTLLSRLDELDDYGFFRVRESGETLWDLDYARKPESAHRKREQRCGCRGADLNPL